MKHEDFIKHHIKKKLIDEGFSQSVAQRGADYGANHYRRCSQASARRRMFDDCFRLGKVWAQKLSTPSDKRESKNKAEKAIA